MNDELDEHSPIVDIHFYIVDKPLKRNNSDKHSVDKQGEALLNMCKASGLRILNGRIKGDRYGRFTRYPVSHRETPSTLDYIITDEDCINTISHFMVLSSLGITSAYVYQLQLRDSLYLYLCLLIL